MANPTWDRRELVLLEAIAAAEEAGERTHTTSLVEQTGLSDLDARLGLRALYDAEFIDGIDSTTNEIFDMMLIRLLERGRRAIGQWPAEDQYAALLQVLDRQIGEARDDDARGRLERIRDSIVSAGREIAVSLASSWARHMVGPPPG